jgi:putative sigma-54 modulation protein
MHVTITCRNIALTPALREYAERKLARLERFFDGLGTAHVVLRVEKHRHVAEATLSVRELILRAEESTADLYASLDQLTDKLERQLLRHKDGVVAHGGRGARAGRGEAASREAAPASAAGEGPHIVRMKRFAMKPLGVEDAALQMDLLGHTFYVFRNAQTDEVNVIYARRDGNYGLIEPEV